MLAEDVSRFEKPCSRCGGQCLLCGRQMCSFPKVSQPGSAEGRRTRDFSAIPPQPHFQHEAHALRPCCVQAHCGNGLDSHMQFQGEQLASEVPKAQYSIGFDWGPDYCLPETTPPRLLPPRDCCFQTTGSPVSASQIVVPRLLSPRLLPPDYCLPGYCFPDYCFPGYCRSWRPRGSQSAVQHWL